MIRSIAIAATLGALVAGVAAYAIHPSMRPSEPNPAGQKPAEQAAAAPDGWPICTMTVTMPDADWAKLDPEFAAGKKAMVAENWDGAIAVLKSAALRDPGNADIQNYIGYAYRRLR
jgi:hypothetical protein